MALRWGICGAGKVANDFLIGINVLPAEKHQVISVAARNLGRAQDFADRHKIANAYGSYVELAADHNVDVAYIGVVIPCHYEATKLMLHAGKHVLCEKPLALNRKQAQEMVDLARAKNLFLMEGVWSRCFPIYQRLREELAKETIGRPLQVTTHLCLPVENAWKWKKRANGGGAALGLGVYPIQLALLVFKEKPVEVKAIGHLSNEDVDNGTTVSMQFSGGRFCMFHVDLRYKGVNSATIYGTDGKLELPERMLTPSSLVTPSGTIEIPLPQPRDDRKASYESSTGFSYIADTVRDCIIDGQTECHLMTLEETLTISSITDEIRQQIGVAYEGDTEI